MNAVRVSRACILFSMGTLIGVAHADKLTYGVDAGLGETDNVTLTHSDKMSQTIAVTDLDLDYKKTSQRLDVSARGNFSYLDYLQNAYGNQLLGRFDGTANVALIPQRLTWFFQDSFGQAAIDPFTPTTPNNLENINYAATGPNIYLRPGGASFVDLSARVARTQFEDSPLTNTRALGSAALGLKLSALSSVSANVDTQRVTFQNTVLNSNFELTDVFLRYELQGARTELSADGGVTLIAQNGSSTTNGLAKFSLSRKLTESARLVFTLGHDSIDGSTSFSNVQAPSGTVSGGASPAINTSENYVSKYASVGWDYKRNRTTLSAIGRFEKDDYADQPTLNRALTSGEVRLKRLLNQAFVVQVSGRLFKSDYANVRVLGPNGSPDNLTSSVAASLTWRHGRALELKLTGEHTSYSTSPNDIGYRENRVFFTVGYRPFREANYSEVPDTGS